MPYKAQDKGSGDPVALPIAISQSAVRPVRARRPSAPDVY